MLSYLVCGNTIMMKHFIDEKLADHTGPKVVAISVSSTGLETPQKIQLTQLCNAANVWQVELDFRLLSVEV